MHELITYIWHGAVILAVFGAAIYFDVVWAVNRQLSDKEPDWIDKVSKVMYYISCIALAIACCVIFGGFAYSLGWR